MLKVMIVGAGGIAPAHIEGFLNFPLRAEIAVIANPTISKAEALISRYKLNAVAVSDFEEKLDIVDVVVICSPPNTHKNMAVIALNRGKHVLLEKPMAISLEECDAILYAAKNSGCMVSVVAQSRFVSSIYNTMKIIHKGDYGRLLFSQINSFWWRGQSYYDMYWRGLWDKEGGGCTLNQAVHHIDLLLWSKGLPIEVNSFLTNINHDNSEEEDLSMSILKYADGTMAQITASLIHHGEVQKLDFQMENASISIPFSVKSNKQRSNGFPIEDSETVKRITEDFDNLPALKYEHHDGQIYNFLNSIEHGEPLLVDGVEGRRSIEIISAIYKSAFTNEKVLLPLKKEDPYYSLSSRVEGSVHFNKKKRSVKSFKDNTITSFKGKF